MLLQYVIFMCPCPSPYDDCPSCCTRHTRLGRLERQHASESESAAHCSRRCKSTYSRVPISFQDQARSNPAPHHSRLLSVPFSADDFFSTSFQTFRPRFCITVLYLSRISSCSCPFFPSASLSAPSKFFVRLSGLSPRSRRFTLALSSLGTLS